MPTQTATRNHYNWLPHVRTAVDELADKFDIDTVGTYPGHQPTMSMAADFMNSDVAKGDSLAAYAKANAKRLGIQYIIWNTKIWNIQRDSEGWRPYRGTTNPHKDHIHISFYSKPGTGGPPITDSFPGISPIDPLLRGFAKGMGPLHDLAVLSNAIGRLFGWMSNAQNWWNLLLILVGVILVFMSLQRMAGGQVMDIVKVVSK